MGFKQLRIMNTSHKMISENINPQLNVVWQSHPQDKDDIPFDVCAKKPQTLMILVRTNRNKESKILKYMARHTDRQADRQKYRHSTDRRI